MDPIPTSARLAEAFAYAAALHGRHNRKGTSLLESICSEYGVEYETGRWI